MPVNMTCMENVRLNVFAGIFIKSKNGFPVGSNHVINLAPKSVKIEKDIKKFHFCEVNMIKEAVREYLSMGLQPIPVDPDTKEPMINWKQYQETRFDDQHILSLFKFARGVALITGSFWMLEVIDIDNHIGNAERIKNDFFEILWNTDKDIVEKICCQRTQSGGYHILFRCIQPENNQKLARHEGSGGSIVTVVETRGEGGYFLVHPTPKYYFCLGDIQKLKILTNDESELLREIGRTFNEVDKEEIQEIKKVEVPRTTHKSTLRPGDDFEDKISIDEILLPAGWVCVGNTGDKQHWRRPGKKKGISATWNHVPGKFYNFSSNSPNLEAEKSYSKFALYAIFEHNGNFENAAKALSELGYGCQKPDDGWNSPYSELIDDFI